eukprot:gene4584-14769_t
MADLDTTDILGGADNPGASLHGDHAPGYHNDPESPRAQYLCGAFKLFNPFASNPAAVEVAAVVRAAQQALAEGTVEHDTQVGLEGHGDSSDLWHFGHNCGHMYSGNQALHAQFQGHHACLSPENNFSYMSYIGTPLLPESPFLDSSPAPSPATGISDYCSLGSHFSPNSIAGYDSMAGYDVDRYAAFGQYQQQLVQQQQQLGGSHYRPTDGKKPLTMVFEYQGVLMTLQPPPPPPPPLPPFRHGRRVS